jgi:hypothetical protein
MTQELQGTGHYRGTFIEYGLRKTEGTSVAVSVVAMIDDYWDDELQQWIDCRSSEYTVRGESWIIGKDNKGPNRNAIESLVRYSGWDASVDSVINGTWQPTPCSFNVVEDVYKDEVRYKIGFLNAYDKKPGMVGNVSPEEAKQLQQQYGSQLRALVGNIQRNAVAPQGRPSMPKQTAPQRAQANVAAAKKELAAKTEEMLNQELNAGDDIPF